jgi:preprotein translocase subunit SecG
MTFVIILIIIICVLLSIIVLIQNPKGGGINASYSGISNQILGARRSTDVVEKATWTLAALLLVFSLSTGFFIDKKAASKEDKQQSEIEKVELGKPAPMPTSPTAPQPGQQPAPPAGGAPN